MAKTGEKPRPTLAETFGDVAAKLLVKENAIDYRDGALKAVDNFWKLWAQADTNEQTDLTAKLLTVMVEEARTLLNIKNAFFMKGREAGSTVCHRLATEFLNAQKRAPIPAEQVQEAISSLKYFGQFYMNAAVETSGGKNKDNTAASETCFSLTKKLAAVLPG